MILTHQWRLTHDTLIDTIIYPQESLFCYFFYTKSSTDVKSHFTNIIVSGKKKKKKKKMKKKK